MEDQLICAMCNSLYDTEDKWAAHTLECDKTKRFKKFKCEACMYSTNKSSDIKRHVARMYIKTVSDRRDSETDWERQDPGPVIDILGPLSDLEQGVMSETPQKSTN